MSLMGIHFSHDTTIAFSPDGKTFVSYELERLVKKRYFSADYKYDGETYSHKESIYIAKTVSDIIKKEFGEESLNVDELYLDQLFNHETINPNREHFLKVLSENFNFKKEPTLINHHFAHANSAFYQSPFEEALVVTIDGGGLFADLNRMDCQFFVIHYMNRNGETREIADKLIHVCSLYSAFPLIAKDITGSICSIAGKAMGLQSYGRVRTELKKNLKPFFDSLYWVEVERDPNDSKRGFIKNDFIYNAVKEVFPYVKDLKNERLEFWDAADLLCTVQQLFEEAIIENIKPYIYKYNLPIVLGGGAALNVLCNTRIKNEFKLPVFVPCNANDSGTAIGGIFAKCKPKEQVNLSFSNFDLFDRDELPSYVSICGGKKVEQEEIISLIRQGKIIGVVRGRSECGPRALGNRSIICDPSFKDMKDILNSKVKQREWYRPFAPMVLQNEASEYFVWDNSDAPFMSFSAHVRSKYHEKLASITHVDYSARIQTITEENNPWYFSLLNKMKSTGLPVLLNTSFNIKGAPILNSIKDAFYVLDNTELDCLIIEDYLFTKD